VSPMRYPFTLATPAVPRLAVRRENTALLIQDMQRWLSDPDCGYGSIARSRGIMREFVEYYGQVEKATANITRVLTAARERDIPVIFTRWACEEGMKITLVQKSLDMMLDASDPGAAIMPQLSPRSTDKVVSKGGFSAFSSAVLQDELVRLGIENLVISGVISEFGIRATAMQAVDLGYRPLLLNDACAGMTAGTHSAMMSGMTYATMKTRSTAEFIRVLENLDVEDVVLI